jgi:lipocalin-like protein
MSVEHAEPEHGDIVGTWHLVSWELHGPTGEVTYPLGPDALGRITYTTDGFMSVLITARGRRPYASGDMFGGTVDEMASTAGSSAGYCGPYERIGDTVIHNLDLCTFPNWETTQQERFISWQDGRLVLRANRFVSNGGEQEAVLVWERAGAPESTPIQM